jgi:hypothetical protein
MAGIMGDVTNNLLGLQQLAAGRQQMEQNNAIAENNKLASESLRKYYQSAQLGTPDNSALNEAFLRSPDLAKKMLEGVGISDKRRGQDAASYALSAYQNIDNPAAFVDLTKSRIDYLKSQGRDAKESEAVLQKYLSGDKESVRSGTKILASSLANQGYLDKDLYAQVFGIQAPISPAQQAQLDLDKQRIGLQREGLGLQREGLEIDRLKATQKATPKPLDASDIKGISQDVSTLLKETNLVHRAAKSLEALEDRGSPLSQTAAVFQFMKSLDPTSAVRETEQGQVYDAQGAASGIAAKLNKLIGEGGLTKEGFKDIVDTSKALANSAIDASERQIGDYLTPYGETIPENFKSSISKRVPSRFEGVQKTDRPPLDSFQRN